MPMCDVALLLDLEANITLIRTQVFLTAVECIEMLFTSGADLAQFLNMG